MRKNEKAYRLRCEGFTNSEIAEYLGVPTKAVPTIAKAHMERHGLPHWSEVRQAVVCDSEARGTETRRQTKGERAYTLRSEGFSNAQVAAIIGVQTKAVPTLAKAHMERYGLPHWGQFERSVVRDSEVIVDEVAEAIEDVQFTEFEFFY